MTRPGKCLYSWVHYCQCNKGQTSKPKGPLHLLPVPKSRGNSVCLDFMGPLPEDEEFNCVLMITDCLGSDVCIIPTRMNISAQKLASIFFSEWYCKNGLPLKLISDCDKLFVSKFWKALHMLTGMDLKMSTAYHPQMDDGSERTNKTLNQCIHFHVEQNQKGWVSTLPIIWFNIMNTVNASTRFSGFQLCMGHSPCILLPIVPATLQSPPAEEIDACTIVSKMLAHKAEAKDVLLTSKILQAFWANKNRGAENVFKVGDQVMLSTLH